jgi:hypothetical protein
MQLAAIQEETIMLFMIHYRPKDGWTEAIAKRATRLFDNWKPPAGFNIKAHYARSDSEGGLVIVEAESPAAIMEATSTFALFYEHNVNPIVEISQAVPIVHRTTQWRDSIA